MNIGMTQIETNIINKRGKLTQTEREIVHQHTKLGFNILKKNKFEKPVLDMALYHHERFDGSGYNSGIRGEDINEYARIAAIADSYDAITSERVHQKQTGNISALEELYRNEHLYDPVILEALMRVVLKNERLIDAFKSKTS